MPLLFSLVAWLFRMKPGCSKLVQPAMFGQPASELQPALINDTLKILSLKLIALPEGCEALSLFAAETA